MLTFGAGCVAEALQYAKGNPNPEVRALVLGCLHELRAPNKGIGHSTRGRGRSPSRSVHSSDRRSLECVSRFSAS